MLIQRIIGAAIILAVVGLPLLYGGLSFTFLVAVIASAAVVELARMFAHLGYRPLTIASVGLTVVIVLDAYFQMNLVGWGVTVGVLAPMVWLVFTSDDLDRGVIEWSVTLVGPFYLGWTLSHVILLRQSPAGLVWAGVALLGTWAADIGAYFAGRALGRHKLYPRVSPGKTWEGVGGGVLLSVVVLAAFLFLVQQYALVSRPVGALPLWVHGVVLGVLITGAAVIGDLSESFLKRGAGVKDAGRVIPGHGGLLDRLDSLVFSAPLVYYYVVWVAVL